jgi:class 3 adenylate cyclase
VDLALHIGEVLYGNVGAVDRLDFTVIGPAVNEVARIETLCEPLGRKVLVSRWPRQLATAFVLSRSATTSCAVYASRAQSMGWFFSGPRASVPIGGSASGAAE